MGREPGAKINLYNCNQICCSIEGTKFRHLIVGPHNVPGKNLTNNSEGKNPLTIWLLKQCANEKVT